MMYLKADTAVEVPVGPAVAVGDGFTPVTNLVAGDADQAELLKYNGNTAITTTAISGTLAAITGADGYYTLGLTTTDTNTEGFMILLINDLSLILPIRLEFQVVAANIYDSMFSVAGTDVLDINVKEISGNSTAADNAQADYDGTGYNKSNSTIGTASVLTGHTAQTANHTASVALILEDTAVIGAAGVGLSDLGGMSDAMKAEVNAQADTAIGDASLATAAALATVDGIVDDILEDTSTTLDTKLNTIDGIVDNILVDTETTLDGKLNTIDGIVDAILEDTGTTLDGKINTIDGIVDDILLDTAVIGSLGAGLTDITDRLPAAMTKGTSDSGTTTTMVDAARTESDTDYWVGSLIRITSGTSSGQTRLITGFTPASDTITFAPATTQAITTNTYEILPASSLETIINYLEADLYIDDSVTPWAHVLTKKGSGGPGAGTELLRRELLDTSDANITDTTTVIGSAVE